MASSELEALLQKAVDDGVAPNFFATFTNSSGIVAAAAVNRKDEPRKFDPDETILYQASLAKLPLSIATLALVKKFNFDIDSHEDLVKYVPEFKLGTEHPFSKIVVGWEEVDVEKDGKKVKEERPILKNAKVGVTLKHLFEQTSGVVHQASSKIGAYFLDWNEIMAGKLSAYAAPRAFEAGEGWEYGFSGDWIAQWVIRISGLTLEDAERKYVWDPLGVDPKDAGIILDSEQKARLPGGFVRGPEPSTFIELPLSTPMWQGRPPEGYAVVGSGGLYSTSTAFATLLRAVLRGGITDSGERLLDQESWSFGLQDGLEPRGFRLHGYKSHGSGAMGEMDEFADLLPDDDGTDKGAGWIYLSLAKYRTQTKSGLSAGSLGWGGIANTFAFVDLKKDLAGFLGTQMLPFMDEKVIKLRDDLERWAVEQKATGMF